MLRCPLSLPLSKSYGARPTRAAIAAHLPEFGQQGDERDGQHRADAWHRGQQLIALSESHIGGNHLGHALVEEADIGLQSHLAAFAEPPMQRYHSAATWMLR